MSHHPFSRRVLTLAATATTCAAVAVALPVAAGATPVSSATYSASTTSDLLSIDANLAGLSLADAELGASTATTASQNSTATAGNLRTAVVGLAVPLQTVSQSAPPDHPSAATAGFDAIDVLPLLDTNLIDAAAQARSAALGTCLPSGTAISTGSASTAGVSVGGGLVPSLTGGAGVGDVADVGAIASTSTTSLVNLDNNAKDVRAVESKAVSSLASLSLLNNAVKVTVSSPARLSADATGVTATSGVSYTAAAVTVTGPDGAPHALDPQLPITLPIDTRVAGTGLLASVSLTLGAPQSVVNTGTGVSASAALLTADVSIAAYVAGIKTAELASVDLAIAPMTVSAAAPTTGVQCLSAPPAPVITSPAPGTTTIGTAPVSGTGTPGDPVSVTDANGPVCGPVTVAPDGTWTCTPDPAIAPGPVTTTATESNPAGSTPSDPVSYTIASNAPATPTITAPAPGSTVTDNTPTINGTGTPGDPVSVSTTDGPVCGPVNVGSGGDWSCTPTTALPEGPNTITATETNTGGSTDSAPDTFTVTSEPPAAPVITTPASGSTVTDNTPTITGTGTPGDPISVSTTDEPVCGPVNVGSGGDWSCTPTTALPEGPNTITATETNAAGSTDSAPDTFTVASNAPDAPTLTSPTNGSVVNNGTVAFTGTGISGDTVTVMESGSPLCTGMVANADWHCSPTTGLTVGVHSVAATQQGSGGSSAPSPTVTFVTTVVGTRFVSTTPYRVLDTRSSTKSLRDGGRVAKGGSVTLSAAALKIAKGTASAVVLNLTLVDPSAKGYATAYPSDQTRPAISSINYAKGRTRANLVIVPVAADGSVTVYVSQSADVVGDVFGYFSTGLVSASGGLYHAVAPARLLDTRTNNTPLGAGKRRTVVVTRDGVPSTGVASVVLNLTVAHPTTRGWVAAFPTDSAFDLKTSNINFYAGDVASVRAIVPVGKNGSVTFFNHVGTTSLVVDVVGYFSAKNSGDTTGSQFVAIDPTRAIDTRAPSINTKQAPLVPGENRVIKLAGSALVPSAGTVAVVSNLTAVAPTKNGYLTEYRTGTTKAHVSDVNYVGGQTVSNLVIGAVDTAGDATLYSNRGGQTNVIEDVFGYFTTDTTN